MKNTILALLVAIAAAQAQTKPAAPAVKLPPQAPDVAAEKFGPDGKVNAASSPPTSAL